MRDQNGKKGNGSKQNRNAQHTQGQKGQQMGQQKMGTQPIYNGPERRRVQQNAERWGKQDRRQQAFAYGQRPTGK